MAHQMKLTLAQFNEFVNPLTIEKYLEILIQGKHLRQQSQEQKPTRSLVVDKGSKREVSAHCDVCRREFISSRKTGERQGDVLARLQIEFDEHKCQPN